MLKINHHRLFVLIVGAAGYLLVACAPTPPLKPALPPVTVQNALQRVSIEQLPQFEDHRSYRDLGRSIQKSMDYLRRLPPDRQIQFGPDQYPVSHLIHSLEVFARWAAANPPPEELNAKLRAHFQVYRIRSEGAPPVLFTGYYEPLLQGSQKRSSRFPTPIHAKPSDMVEIDLTAFAPDLKGRRIVGRFTGKTVVPYPTRGQIRNNNNFNAVAKPIAWLKDEIDLFVLQIQGSGKVQLPDGELLSIQYSGSNGRPYRSVGRLLIDNGAIPAREMSMQAIRAYLQQHPEQLEKILDHNPRYVFFRRATGEGPVGSLGLPLTPYRSLAVDQKLLPSAALAFMVTRLPRVGPRGDIIEWAPYTGFALAQDAGSAIIGPARADFFMGAGLQAEVAASHLKCMGQLYFLVLKPESSEL